MKNFWNRRFFEPFSQLNWWQQVFLLCNPVCGSFAWLTLAFPGLAVEGTIIPVYRYLSPIALGGATYDLFGSKEAMACLLLTALGAWAIFSHGPIERLFQIFATTITLSMFCFFALFNAETFQNAGLETSFLYGSVYPIVLSAVALVSQSVLFVTAKPSKR